MMQAVQILGQAKRVLTSRGAEQHSKGVDTVLTFINLALALGKAGKADQLPGYRKIDDPVHRAYIASVWGIDPDELPVPGRSAYELLDTMGPEGGVRALFVMASNVVVYAPRAGHVQERLDALDFLAVCDIFLSETAKRADVVLPVTQWAEETGTMTNLEGRVQLRQQAVAPLRASGAIRRY